MLNPGLLNSSHIATLDNSISQSCPSQPTHRLQHFKWHTLQIQAPGWSTNFPRQNPHVCRLKQKTSKNIVAHRRISLECTYVHSHYLLMFEPVSSNSPKDDEHTRVTRNQIVLTCHGPHFEPTIQVLSDNIPNPMVHRSLRWRISWCTPMSVQSHSHHKLTQKKP